MTLPRFSLKRLLIVVTVVALLFGVHQIHRQRILQQVEEFKAQGVRMEIGSNWQDFFWLRFPKEAVIEVTILHGALKLGPEPYRLMNAVAQLELLQYRLAENGVDKCIMEIIYRNRVVGTAKNASVFIPKFQVRTIRELMELRPEDYIWQSEDFLPP